MAAEVKLLAIGLDAMDPELLLRWCDSGDLPTLQRLREQGAWGRLKTPPGFADDAVWSSFCTGEGPGKHGRYHNYYFDSDSYADVLVRYRHLAGTPFWQTLSEAGRRVCVVDVPKCPLTPGLNGIQLADWRVHGRDGPTRSYPVEVAPGVLARFGDDHNDAAWPENYLCSYETLGEKDAEELHRRLISGLEQKTLLLHEMLAQGPWELFLAVFKESHCAGHQYWRTAIHGGSGSQPQSSARVTGGDRLKSVYQALDGAVAELLASIDSDTNLIVFSDIGMGDNFSGSKLLDDVLLRLDENPLLRSFSVAATRCTGAVRMRRRVENLQLRLRRWRSAFALPHNEISGAIRINLQGREAHGRVAPGRHYRRLCDRIEQELLSLRNVSNGAPIVDKVIHPTKDADGAAAQMLPDMLAVWNRSCPITGAYSETMGTVTAPDDRHRPGNHVSDGIFFCVGPGIRAGGPQTGSSIIDLAPTICDLLGVPLSTVEGKSIRLV
jgi:predicted AlkP superfamily phosphohydrolase/phosphomutase